MFIVPHFIFIFSRIVPAFYKIMSQNCWGYLIGGTLYTVALDKMMSSGRIKRIILSSVHCIERSRYNKSHYSNWFDGPGKSIILANIILSRGHYIESHSTVYKICHTGMFFVSDCVTADRRLLRKTRPRQYTYIR